MSRAASSFIYRVYGYLTARPRLAKALTYALLALIVFSGVYIRFAPYFLNDFEFFEFDSYIEYWQALYTYENGPLSWYTLTRDNPATHLFWYPWGRDFVHTSYPLLPMWIGATYHLVEWTGLTLKDWAVLQPLIFSAVGIIVAYLAGRELSGGSRVAGLATASVIAVLPAAIERTVIGFVEKEGISLVPLMLYIYFYSKLAKSMRDESTGVGRRVAYMLLAGFFLALVGWLWGGYVFLLGTVVAFIILYPLLARESSIKEFLPYHIGLVASSMIMVIPSPANASTLGLYPFEIKGLGFMLLASLMLPVVYQLLAVEYRRLGLKKPLLTKGRYLILLVVFLIAGGIAVSEGVIPIGGRLAWALGLRFIPATPLVESVAEHQSPLSSLSSFIGMLHSWGVYPWLFFASPLVLEILGALYLVYKGETGGLYVAVGFLIAFYSYLNAAYMIAAAAYMGSVIVGLILDRIVGYLTPSRRELEDWRKGRVRYGRAKGYRLIALLFVVLAVANIIYAGYMDYTANSSMVYTLKSGLTSLPYYSDSWYKALDAIRSTPNGSLIIAWWDYGYGITVGGGRASAADGATLNETQIGIIGLILTSINTSEAVELARLLQPPVGKTYIMVIDGFVISSDGSVISPVIAGSIPGLVDIPKSIWMIRIGDSVVDILKSVGVNVSRRDTSRYFYVYSLGGQSSLISPAFNEPESIPLLYKLLVDGVMYWAEQNNKTSVFEWITGSTGTLDSATASRIRESLGINITSYIMASSLATLETRPLANDTYIKPYRVIVEPFVNPYTGTPLQASTIDGKPGIVYSVIVLYELNIPP